MTTPSRPDPDAAHRAARHALLDEALGLTHTDTGWTSTPARPEAMGDLAALDTRSHARPPQDEDVEDVDGGGG